MTTGYESAARQQELKKSLDHSEFARVASARHEPLLALPGCPDPLTTDQIQEPLSMATHSGLPELYLHDHLEAKREFFKVFGAAFRLYTHDGRLLAYSKQKAFKLKEDIRVFADEAQTQELLNIQATKMIDWSASYNVFDSRSGEHYGSLRRKGFSSMFRDEWEILDQSGVVRGRIIEESAWKALVRRTVEIAAFFMPQTYLIDVGGVTVAEMAQRFRWFTQEFDVDLSHDQESLLPRPLAIAGVILLLAIEGKQASS